MSTTASGISGASQKDLPFTTIEAPNVCRQRAHRHHHGEGGDGASGSRNLVLVFDGTSNTFGSDMSSMPTLYSLLSADRRLSLNLYQQGIGTGSYKSPFTPSGLVQTVKTVLDLGVAWSLPEHVQEGYNFLVANYTPGDRIYLFGFSRGAFTARALAGMLQEVGLLLKGNEDSTGLAFHIYKQGPDANLAPGIPLASEFKKTFAMDVQVEFVGVWDTVSSVGAIIPRTLPFSAGSFLVRHFRQALALDERRVRFSPQPFMGANANPSFDDDEVLQGTSMKEVWFCGAHSNVGGGATATDGDVTPRLSHLPLRWMVREAMENGLALDLHAVESSPIFSPFIAEAQRLLENGDQNLKEYLSWPGHSFAPGSDPALHAIVYLSTLPSEVTRRDALAPRTDSLSFRIKPAPYTTFGAKAKELWSNFTQRLLTAGWWILETTPTLRIVWDVEGEVRSRRWRWNLGHPRSLTHAPVFHHSVRSRMDAKPSDFPAGDGVSVPEYHYKPAAKPAKGERRGTNTWDEGEFKPVP